MDSRSMSHTSPSNRTSSQIYRDLTLCQLPHHRSSNDALHTIMDFSMKVSFLTLHLTEGYYTADFTASSTKQSYREFILTKF